jgi:hypothetical protein
MRVRSFLGTSEKTQMLLVSSIIAAKLATAAEADCNKDLERNS